MVTQPEPQGEQQPSGLDNLRDLFRKLVKVPKREADEVHEKHTREHTEDT